MPNYENAMIYTIRCKDPNLPLLYVGGTLNFRNRKFNHKSDCNNGTSKKYNMKVYKMIRDNGGWDNFIMKEYAKFPCNDKVELNIEEERVRVMLGGNMNTNKAYSELKGNEYCKQYNEEHREEISEKMKEYYQENKEHIKQTTLQYYHDNKEQIKCSCGGKYMTHNKKNHLKTKKHLKHTTT